MLPIRTILHPTDFSEHSEPAFNVACSLAQSYGARLVLLHVLEPTVLVYGGVMTPPPPLPGADERLSARKQLQRLRPPHSSIPVERLVEAGDSATAIMQVARERNCDLIVMGSHGRTGLGRLLMGSVAENVLRKAPCPVLTVKNPTQAALSHPVVATEAGQEAVISSR